MGNLLLFIKKYSYWFLFLFLELISMVLMFQFNSYQGSVYFTTANAISGSIHSMQSQVTSYFLLGQVNSDLTKQNLLLNVELERLRSRLEQYADTIMQGGTLNEALDSLQYVQAEIIQSSLQRNNNFLTINKGEADGVQEGQGVVNGQGVVGVVYQTTRHYALVMPIINQMTTISCRIRGRKQLGNLRWLGEDVQRAVLQDVPRHAQFSKGDMVETSGFSAMFPPGIPVGKVETLYNSEDGLSYELRIRLVTDFLHLRNVMVLSTQQHVELDVLQDRIKRLEER